MRLLLVCTNADLAGAPVHTKIICNHLALNDDIEFEVVFGETGPIVSSLTKNGVVCHILTRLKSKIAPFNDIILLFQLISLLKKYKPDLVHLHSSKAGMIGRLACFILGVPSIYTVHGWGWRGFGSFKTKLVFLIEKILSRLKGVFYIYVSRSVELEAIQKLGIKKDMGTVIYNGVPDLGFCPEPEHGFSIFMAARVCDAKDHETLIKAFESLDMPSKLYLCGEGTNSNQFLKQIKYWAPHRFSDVISLGVRSDVRDILKTINVFALISNFEALPISIIEAMSSARAVVATDVGGVSELISSGKEGLLVQVGNVEMLADALSQLFSKQLRDKLAFNARERYVREFSDYEMMAAIRGAYLSSMLKSNTKVCGSRV